MLAANYYFPVFILTVTLLCFFVGLRYLNSPDYLVQEKGNPSIFLPLVICLVYAWFLGGRPISNYFGDTVSYAHIYDILDITKAEDVDTKGEWLWSWITNFCKGMGFSVHTYFTIIDVLYFVCGLWALKKFMPDNPLLATLFMLSSLMFYTFGVNGIRNGLSCHIVLLAIAFILSDNYPLGAILFIAAFFIHRSVALPIASFFVAIYMIKDVKLAVYIWLASIVLSLFLGEWFTTTFSSLGFDDRMTTYTTSEYDKQFSRTGFRWDFLLYSAVPIYMMWEVCVKRQISDNWYNTLCITYCLANSFWVMVIRAAFSNRFAYLSWFMYPIIIAYPLIMLPIWYDQDQKTAIILYAYIGFTILMNIMWNAF